jgi:uncharacterized protein involved in tolerance to divalent cations
MDSNEPTCEVVITAPDAVWLADLSRELVEQRLCAGSHITEIRTIYRWQGEIPARHLQPPLQLKSDTRCVTKQSCSGH